MRSAVRGLIGVCVAVTFASAASAALPDYVGFEIQARAAFSNAFNVPNGSSFSTTSPSLSDGRKVAVSFSEPVNFDKQVWAGQGGVTGFLSSVFERASDPKLNAAGDVVWSVSGFFAPTPDDGVWRAVGDVPAKLTTLPSGADDWDEPYIADSGEVGCRPDVFGEKRYVIYDPGMAGLTTVATEGAAFTFLAQPAFNNNLQFGAHVWDATQGDASQLRRFNADGSSDILFTEDATYHNIFNGVDINDGGQLAGQLFRSGGTDLVRVDDSGVTIIAREPEEFSDLALFDPKINNAGIVAFRGTMAGAPEAIWISDGVDRKRVVSVGDEVPSDLGPATLTSFANGWDINNNGDIVFNASISLIGGGGIGRGIFIALAELPSGACCIPNYGSQTVDCQELSAGDCAAAGGVWTDGGSCPADCSCFADLDNSGDIGFDDLNILLAAYGGPGGYAAGDLDGDGDVDFDDLNVLLALYGGVCD